MNNVVSRPLHNVHSVHNVYWTYVEDEELRSVSERWSPRGRGESGSRRGEERTRREEQRGGRGAAAGGVSSGTRAMSVRARLPARRHSSAATAERNPTRTL